MAEYIEREALMEGCKSMIAETWNSKTHPVSWAHAYAEFLDNVERVPAADVVPVVHGRWEFLGPNMLNRDCMCGTCSVCKVRSKYIVNTGLCPNCGAKMEVADD